MRQEGLAEGGNQSALVFPGGARERDAVAGLACILYFAGPGPVLLRAWAQCVRRPPDCAAK